MQRQKHFDPGEARTNPKTTKKLLQKPRQVEKHKLQHVNGELETGRGFKPCTFMLKGSESPQESQRNKRLTSGRRRVKVLPPPWSRFQPNISEISHTLVSCRTR